MSSPGTRLTATGVPRKKPGPKPKPKDPNAPEKKPRKPRKPAEPKDPAAEPAPRKRGGRAKASMDAPPVPTPEQKPMMLQQQPPSPSPQRQTAEPSLLQTEQPGQQSITQHTTVTNNPVEPIHSNPALSHMSNTPSTPRPASSGQRYDPIRSSLYESKPSAASAPPPMSPPLNRASASPSITSLIDPPSMANTNYPQTMRLNQQVSVTSAPQSPVAHASRPGSLLPHQEQPSRPSTFTNTTPMEIDSEPNAMARSTPTAVPMKKTLSSNTSNPSHSNAPTPPATKPPRQKEAPPPLPTGSGLLSGTPFGPAVNGSSTSATDSQGANVWITIPVNIRENKIINFAQEAEKKYGFQALHPKIAARKERLRQVTAAGAAIEKAAGGGSNDDMSLDLSEPESNVEMGGMDDEGSGANGGKKKRKRKQEDYDKEDDFIDDTELAWENQARMAKDGFFVWMGALIKEGENPEVERADGTVKRGRGRGRGGTTRGETTGRGRGRGGGPGSRGGTTVRKPRVTKADRAMMEQEKLEREKMAATLAAKQPMSAFGATSAQ